jgi:hypothetical protein
LRCALSRLDCGVQLALLILQTVRWTQSPSIDSRQTYCKEWSVPNNSLQPFKVYQTMRDRLQVIVLRRSGSIDMLP